MPVDQKIIRRAARKMTEIIQEALDKFPPPERARRAKAFIASLRKSLRSGRAE